VRLLIDALVGGLLAPAGFAVVVLLLFRRLRPQSQLVAGLAGAIALGGGFFVGYALLRFAPLRPEQAWHWLPYAALLACAAGMAESLAKLPSATTWALRTAVAFVLGWLLIPSWPSIAPERAWWILALAAGVLLLWGVFSAVIERMPVLRQSFLLALMCVAAGVVLVQTGSAKFAQLAGVMGAAMGAFWFVECIQRVRGGGERPPNAIRSFGASALRGAAPGIAVLLPGLTLNGYFSSYSEAPLASYLLVALAPAALYLTTIGPLKRLSTRASLVIQSAAVLAILSGALALTMTAEG